MKREEFVFERKHLTAEERLAAVTGLLVHRLGITDEEINNALDHVVELKNKELKKNPGAQAIMSLFNGMME